MSTLPQTADFLLPGPYTRALEERCKIVAKRLYYLAGRARALEHVDLATEIEDVAATLDGRPEEAAE